jgi:hypothetical protein
MMLPTFSIETRIILVNIFVSLRAIMRIAFPPSLNLNTQMQVNGFSARVGFHVL